MLEFYTKGRTGMLSLWTVFSILNLIGNVVCPPGHEDGNGVTCYHCDAHHHHFPSCLSEVHRCDEHEFCHFSNKHDFTISCLGHRECDHILANGCTLHPHTVHNGGCEKCCKDETCVKQQVSLLVGKPSTTKAVTAPPTPARTTSDLNQLASRLLTGVCEDLIAFGGCHTSEPTMCSDPTGVAMCPETCGLCTLLKSAFNGNTTCQDLLLHSECTVAGTPAFCGGPLAQATCPKTCNMCETILLYLIQQAVTLHAATIPATASPAPTTVEVVTTQAPVTAATDLVVPKYSTVDACVDDVDDCSSLPNVCDNMLAAKICTKFCGFCDLNVVDFTPSTPQAVTDAPVTPIDNGPVIQQGPSTPKAITVPPSTPKAITVPPSTSKVMTVPPSTPKAITLPPSTPKAITVPPSTSKIMTVPPSTPKAITVPPSTPKAITVPPSTPKAMTVPLSTPKSKTVPPSTLKVMTVPPPSTPDIMTVPSSTPKAITVPPSTPKTMTVRQSTPEAVTFPPFTPDIMTVPLSTPKAITAGTFPPSTDETSTPKAVTVAQSTPKTVNTAPLTPQTATVTPLFPKVVG